MGETKLKVNIDWRLSAAGSSAEEVGFFGDGVEKSAAPLMSFVSLFGENRPSQYRRSTVPSH